MKITILKKHAGYNPNDTLEVSPERANYWISCGVATAHIPNNEKIDKILDEKFSKIVEVDEPKPKKTRTKKA